MITIISSYAYPANNATANRLRFMAAAIHKKAETPVQIISAPTDKTSTETILSWQKHSPIRIKRFKILFLRAINELIFAVRCSLKINSKSKFQIYTIPSPIMLVPIYLRNRKNFGIDVRDCSWDYLAARGLLGRFASIIIKSILRPIFYRATFVTCTNSFEANSIIKNFNIVATIIPNGIEKVKYEKLININGQRKNKSSSSKVLYAGNIGYAQSLLTLVKSMEIYKKSELEIVGEGSEKDLIKDYLRVNMVKNVTVSPATNWDELARKYASADIFYAQITSDFSSAIPTKIFEYVAMGKKLVLGLPPGPAKEVFSDFSGVFLHEPEDINGCVAALTFAEKSAPPDRESNNLRLQAYIRENYEEAFLKLIPTLFMD